MEVGRERSPGNQGPLPTRPAGFTPLLLVHWPWGKINRPCRSTSRAASLSSLKFPQPQILLSSGLDLLPKHMEPIERICMLTL